MNRTIHELQRLLVVASVAFAPAVGAAPFALEGPLTAVTDEGGHGTAQCNGVLVHIDADTTISSPTASLTLAQLASPDPFPFAGTGPDGVQRMGFLGGTCIVDGDDASGVNLAHEIFVELAENVIVGSVSSDPQNAPGGLLAIQGVKVMPLSDARMPAALPRNQFGFEIDIETVPRGDAAAAEGYFGSDGMLYAHTIETAGGDALADPPAASVLRAECRDRDRAGRDEAEIRGGCLLADGVDEAEVLLEGLPNGGQPFPIGRTTCSVDPLAPPFGSYRFRSDSLTLPGGCPAQVRARLETGGGVDVADVVAR